MNSRLAFSILVAASLFPCSLEAVWLRSFIDLKIPPTAREYCHVVAFPSGWKIPSVDDHDQPLMIDYADSDYEFRVEGLLGTWFLVTAFSPEIDHPYYSNNRYRVNLSDATVPVLPASRKDWNSATVVPLIRKPLFNSFGDVFDTATGRKLFTLQGTYSGNGDPYSCIRKAAWLTERYLIIPLGKRRERCVVCEFSARTSPGVRP